MNIKFKKISDAGYNIYTTNEKGEIIACEGHIFKWDGKWIMGNFNPRDLRAIADKLDQLNKEGER